MTQQAEHGGVVKLEASYGAGALTNYSSNVRSATPPQINNNMEQYHTLESRDPKTTIGGWTGAFTTLDVVRDPAASSLHSVLTAWVAESPPRPRQMRLEMPDSVAGSEYYQAYVLPQSYNAGNARAGSGSPATGQATFMVTSGYSHGTIT